MDFSWCSGMENATNISQENKIINRATARRSMSRTNIATMQDMATRMFGDDDPIGKMVQRNNRTLKVAGAIDGKAENTHIPMGVFMSRPRMPPQAKEQLGQSWGNNSSFNYLVLGPGVNEKDFQSKMDAFVTKYIIPAWGGEQFHGEISFNLEPLREVHFNNDLIYDTPKKATRRTSRSSPSWPC